MAIDVSGEDLLSLSEACRAIPPHNGKVVHKSTVTRWMFDGIRGVRLDYIRYGRKLYTSQQALTRFSAALAETDQRPASTPTTPPKPRRQLRSMQEAEAICDAAGIR